VAFKLHSVNSTNIVITYLVSLINLLVANDFWAISFYLLNCDLTNVYLNGGNFLSKHQCSVL